MTRLAIGHIMYSKPTAQRDGMPMAIGHTDMAKINAHVEQCKCGLFIRHVGGFCVLFLLSRLKLT